MQCRGYRLDLSHADLSDRLVAGMVAWFNARMTVNGSDLCRREEGQRVVSVVVVGWGRGEKKGGDGVDGG